MEIIAKPPPKVAYPSQRSHPCGTSLPATRGELEHVLVISIEVSFEFPLSNNHQVTFRAFFRVGMFVIEMAIEGFPRVKYGVA